MSEERWGVGVGGRTVGGQEGINSHSLLPIAAFPSGGWTPAERAL